jgi:cytochrome c-type biogenesis protein CcmH
MAWVIILLFAALLLAGLWWLGKLRGGPLQLSAAAMLAAVAGYALQGSPTYSGVQVKPTEETVPEVADETFRKAMQGGEFTSEGEALTFADSLNKYGRSRLAVAMLNGAIERSPQNPDLWVGLGNSLVIHGGGMMNPAAQYAFEKAAQLSPNHPGPPFFFGLALAQSGKMDEAGDVWRGLLSRAPADAPWRDDLVQRLTQIGQMPVDGGKESSKPSTLPSPPAS